MRISFFIISVLVSAAASFRAEAQVLIGYDEPAALAVYEPSAVIPATGVTVFDLDTGLAGPAQMLSAPYTPPPSSEPPVDLEADNLTYDDAADVVRAQGDVFLAQSGRILRADDMRYSVNTDVVEAHGDVVLSEPNGDIHYAEKVTYNNKLRDGAVERLLTTMTDGSRFTAESGEREGGVVTTMHKASYTPCEPCKAEPEKDPLWAIKARTVKHDAENQTIAYENATFEALGVPIMYVPYFSHADGTVDQKSGFLAPSAGYKSELGAFVETSYYWGIAPDQDATFGVIAMTDQAPLGLAEYRKRWDKALFEIAGGITASDRKDRKSGQSITQNDEARGHVFAKGRWDMDEKWRSGFDVNWASDDQYMRQYDFTNEDVLENDIYAERFSGRDYASARVIAYQDIRLREVEDQPNVLPEILASFQGEPGNIPLIKGNWTADFGVLGLTREGDDPDMLRTSGELGWKRRLVSDYGFLTKVGTSVRGDAYQSNDRLNASAGSGRSRSGMEMRYFPQASLQTSYPMARAYESFQAKIEPVVSVTAAPNMSERADIPNEDSQSVQIDASNLFEANRFPGLDRVEDQSRVTYGLRSGVFGYDNSSLDMFIGQSYRFDDRNNPFPNGSGLEDQESDVVGSLSGNYKDVYSLDYRYQLGGRHLTSQRHEVDASVDWNRFRLRTNYLFARALEGTDIDESREQLKSSADFYVTPQWRLRGGATQDLGIDPGLRETYASIDYLGQCLFWSVQAEKNFTNDVSGENDVAVVFRIGLKNLGEFEESAYRSDITQN